LLAGCSFSLSGSDGAYSYFPPVDKLPAGVEPLPTSDPAWPAASERLHLDGNPGKADLQASGLGSGGTGAGNLTSVHVWLLRDTQGAHAFAMLVLTFRDTASVDALAKTPASLCTAQSHVLRDHEVLVVMRASGSGDAAREAGLLDGLAQVTLANAGSLAELC
jgi:hypothetical protein